MAKQFALNNVFTSIIFIVILSVIQLLVISGAKVQNYLQIIAY